MELDGEKRKMLVQAIVDAFKTPAAVETWIGTELPGENAFNIFAGTTFDARTLALITWAEARGVETLLQKLADKPPIGAALLPMVVFLVSDGAIRPSPLGGLPPIAPHLSWFVTRRPFANRSLLRTALETFETAAPGADSVLVIEGNRFQGKTYGARFARQVAGPVRAVSVDVAQFDRGQMNAADLAHALDRYADRTDFPAFDITKEDEAVPRLLSWLIGKLSNTDRWLIVDHCDRANLTPAARELLRRVAGSVEDGTLPGVRLILADIDRGKLPQSLRWNSRHDRAELPTQDQVKDWCRGVASYLGKTCCPDDVDTYATEVFTGLADALDEERSARLEQGLVQALQRIKALKN